MAHMKTWDCCFDLWKDERYAHRGVSDAHLAFHLERVLSKENPRTLIIRRDLNAVKASLLKIAPETGYVDQLAAAIDRFATHPAIAWVSFEALSQLPIVRQCLQYLMPGCEPDDARIKELIDLNIQADMDVVWQRALESRSHMNQILGIDAIPGMNAYQ